MKWVRYGILLLALSVLLACGYFRKEEPAPTREPAPVPTATVSAVSILLTRQASDRARLMVQHQEMLQGVSDGAGTAPLFRDERLTDPVEQMSALQELDRELEATLLPQMVPLADWYRPGGGDQTRDDVWDSTPFGDVVFPLDPRCVAYSALLDGLRRPDLYRLLYQLLGETQPDFAVSWSEFRELAAANFAWELLRGDVLRIRVWTVIVVVDYEGNESRWVLGGLTTGEVRHYEEAQGGAGEGEPVSGGFACPVFNRTQLDEGELQELPHSSRLIP